MNAPNFVVKKLFGKKSQIALLVFFALGIVVLSILMNRFREDDVASMFLSFVALFFFVAMCVSYCAVTFFSEIRGIVHEYGKELGKLKVYCTKRTAIITSVLFIVLLIWVYPILRSDFNYIDDLGHNFYGIPEWGWNFGRWILLLANCISNFNVFLCDTSPLQQVLSCIVLLAVALTLAAIFSSLRKSSKLSIPVLLASLAMVFNPYFLENMTYKYESIGMALSILFAIAPFLFYGNKKAFFFSSIAMNLFVCLSYQASNGVFSTMTLFVGLVRYVLEDDFGLKELFSFYVLAAISFVIGLMFFYVPFSIMDHSGASYRSTDISVGGSMFSVFFRNQKIMAKILIHDFNAIWKTVIALTAVSFIVQSLRRTRKSKSLVLALDLMVLALGFLLCLGAYSILSVPADTARMIYGSVSFIALIGISAVTFARDDKASKWLCVLPLAMTLMFFSYGFIYGNAIKAQLEYEDRIRDMVLSDLNQTLESKDGKYSLGLKGSVGFAPLVEHVQSLYPITHRLIPILLFGGGYGQFEIIQYSGYEFVKLNERDKDKIEGIEDYKVIAERLYYKILRSGDNVIVEFT